MLETPTFPSDLRLVNSKRFFKFKINLILGALFIKTVFGETDRSKANELIKNIRQTFEENLRKLQWIDEESKTEATKKLNKINEKIGYPDFIKDQTKLNER